MRTRLRTALAGRYLFPLFAMAGVLGVHQDAHAVNCTISGAFQIQSMDSYYCDSNHQPNCTTNWKENDLDSTTKPLRYALVTVNNAVSGDELGRDFTDNSGGYSITFDNGANCSGAFSVRFWYLRVHESDTQSSDPRYRFRLIPWTSNSTYWVSWLTGVGTFNKTFTRNQYDLATQLANIYYTANSAITEISSWTTNLSDEFATSNFAASEGGILRISYDGSYPVTWYDPNGTWSIGIGASDFARGTNIRHEIGHATHDAMHHKNMSPFSCYSDNFNSEVGHGSLTCEYGYEAMTEAMASFVAVRSIVTAGNKAFLCGCVSNNHVLADQDRCSEIANGGYDNDDRVQPTCGSGFTGGWYGVGDDFADAPSRCALVRQSAAVNGCNCPDENGNDVCDEPFPTSQDPPWNQRFGYRNETQIVRFLWDYLDFHAESGDNDDYDVADIALAIEGVTCGENSGYGVDGTCNEPDRAPGVSCNPSADGAVPGLPMFATRDSYNIYDIASVLPGDQTTERTLNCVQGLGGSPDPMD